MVRKLMKWTHADAYRVLELVGLNLFSDIHVVYLFQLMTPKDDAYEMQDVWYLHIKTTKAFQAELTLTDKKVVDSLLKVQ